MSCLLIKVFHIGEIQKKKQGINRKLVVQVAIILPSNLWWSSWKFLFSIANWSSIARKDSLHNMKVQNSPFRSIAFRRLRSRLKIRILICLTLKVCVGPCFLLEEALGEYSGESDYFWLTGVMVSNTLFWKLSGAFLTWRWWSMCEIILRCLSGWSLLFLSSPSVRYVQEKLCEGMQGAPLEYCPVTVSNG